MQKFVNHDNIDNKQACLKETSVLSLSFLATYGFPIKCPLKFMQMKQKIISFLLQMINKYLKDKYPKFLVKLKY